MNTAIIACFALISAAVPRPSLKNHPIHLAKAKAAEFSYSELPWHLLDLGKNYFPGKAGMQVSPFFRADDRALTASHGLACHTFDKKMRTASTLSPFQIKHISQYPVTPCSPLQLRAPLGHQRAPKSMCRERTHMPKAHRCHSCRRALKCLALTALAVTASLRALGS